jgi:hypothetical protein
MSLSKCVTRAVLALLLVGSIAEAANWKGEMVTCMPSWAGVCPNRKNPPCNYDCIVRWDEAKCAGCVEGTRMQHEDPTYQCGCSWTELHRSYNPLFNWDNPRFAYVSVMGCYGTCK